MEVSPQAMTSVTFTLLDALFNQLIETEHDWRVRFERSWRVREVSAAYHRLRLSRHRRDMLEAGGAPAVPADRE